MSALFVFRLSASTPLLLFPLCPQSVFGLFTHPLPLQHYPTLFSQLLFLLSTLYSLRVYISFTGKSSRLRPGQYLCCGECCPLFPAFYHLNISPKQLIYFLTAVFFFLLLSLLSPPLRCPELATSRLGIKRNGRSESTVEEKKTSEGLKMEPARANWTVISTAWM